MAYPEYEKLFLLEVLVDNVYIDTTKLDLDKNTVSNLKETCVMFQFLDYPPLVVCEEDFFKAPPCPENSQVNFNNGKSCIFSISSKLVPMLPYKFDIKVNVLRKLQPTGEKIVIGTCTLDLGDSFTAIMHSSVAAPDLPLQKTKSGTHEISDKNNKPVGYINAFVRLSCFGQLIVTQFQVGASSDFMFKGTEPKMAVEIPGDSTKIPKFEVDPSYKYPIKSDKTRSEIGYGDSKYTIPSKTTIASQAPSEDTGDYKEIVAEIRGHSLHIRVPMKSKKDKENSGKICKKKLMAELEDEAPVCINAKPPKLCDCDFPVPMEAMQPQRCPRY